MSEWKDARKERPEQNACCIVMPKFRSHQYFAVYDKDYDIFMLDEPGSRHGLMPIDVAYYLEIPDPPRRD